MINLVSMPPAIDEARHILRSQMTIQGDLFIGMRESLKQLYIWLIAIFLNFSDNQLFVARITSVLCGLVTGGVCYRLAEAFYPGPGVKFIAALFYLLSPFALFYDRMALTDSLLTMLVGVTILTSVRLWQHPSVMRAVALGGVLGLATLAKTYAVFYYPTPLFLWLVWGRNIRWSQVMKLLGIVYLTTFFAWLPIIFIGQEAYQQDHFQKLVTAGPEINFVGVFWYYNARFALDW